jgi:hypothetical protein
MKNSFFMVLAISSFIACNSDATKQNQKEETKSATTTLPDNTAVKKDTMQDQTYVCPMHPEVTSTKAGEKCPKCGMDLVIKK